MSTRREEEMSALNAFWTWGGRYAGYRISDSLFGFDGRQIGYFAEGDEVYGCSGEYIGEVRGGNRLITNLSKKKWTRQPLLARVLKSSPGHPSVSAKDMLAGFEDFRVLPSGSEAQLTGEQHAV